jgi:hypothetical protein
MACDYTYKGAKYSLEELKEILRKEEKTFFNIYPTYSTKEELLNDIKAHNAFSGTRVKNQYLAQAQAFKNKVNNLNPGLLKIEKSKRKKGRAGQSLFYLTINDSFFTNRQGLLFQTGSDSTGSSQQELDNLLERLKPFLSKLNISVEFTNNIKERYGIDAIGVADILNKLILLKEGKADIKTIAEEVGHFAVEALGEEHPYIQRLLQLVESTERYSEKKDDYLKLYKEDEKKVKIEVIGDLLGDALIKQNKALSETLGQKIVRVLEKVWKEFRRLLTGLKQEELHQEIRNAVENIADDIISGNLDTFKKENLNKDNIYAQLDTENFKNSKILDSFKEQLDDAIKLRTKKLAIFGAKQFKELTEGEKKRIKKLKKLQSKSLTTLGLVEFINIAGKDAEDVSKRLDILVKSIEKRTPTEVARQLNKALSYIEAYEPIINKLLAEVEYYNQDFEKVELIREELKDIMANITKMKNHYSEIGVPILAETLFKYGKNNPNLTVEKIEEMLRLAPKDITVIRRWWDSLAESGDDILAITDKMVNTKLEVARQETLEKTKDLVNEFNSLGIKDLSNYYERDANGNLTGNLVSEYNQGEYKRQLDLESKRINKLLGLPDDRQERHLILEQDSKVNHEYKKLWGKWHSNNSQSNPKYEQLIKDKEQYFKDKYVTEEFDEGLKIKQEKLAKEMFDEWLGENRGWSNYLNDYYYKFELSIPAEKYYNPVFNELVSSKHSKLFGMIWDLKEEMDKSLPEEFVNPYLAPQIRKDWIERLKKDPKKVIKEVGDTFKKREDDTEFGMQYALTDENDRPVDFLPVFFTRRLEDMNDLSTDIVDTMSSYIYMATKYKALSEVVDVLELEDRLLRDRKISTGKEDPVTGHMQVKEKAGGNSYERFKDWMSMVVYGKMKADETWLSGLGIDTAKTVDAFGRYVSINNLALNIYAGLANPILGNALIREEGIAKEYVDNKDLLWADKTFSKNLPGMIGDIGKVNQENKMSLFLEKVDFLQDFDIDIKELNTSRNRITRLATMSSLYFTNKIGEIQMQGRMALALAHNYKLTLHGKETNLYNALEKTKDSKIIIPEGLKKEDGSDFTIEDLADFTLRLKGINQRLHGIYNRIDKSALHRWSLGRMALMFRGWLKPGFNRRFEDTKFNYNIGTEVEGFYRTGYNFLKQLILDIKEGQFSVARNWKKLSSTERANMYRLIAEVSYMLSAVILINILQNLSDDDEENKALDHIAYQANRFYTEMSMWTPVLGTGEALKIMKSPAAGINQLQTLSNYTKSIDPFGYMFRGEEFFPSYKSGRHEGQKHFWVNTKRLIPLFKTVEDYFHPDEKLKFYN